MKTFGFRFVEFNVSSRIIHNLISCFPNLTKLDIFMKDGIKPRSIEQFLKLPKLEMMNVNAKKKDIEEIVKLIDDKAGKFLTQVFIENANSNYFSRPTIETQRFSIKIIPIKISVKIPGLLLSARY
jgi:Zn-dependent M16 (insulinase) family peptidase